MTFILQIEVDGVVPKSLGQWTSGKVISFPDPVNNDVLIYYIEGDIVYIYDKIKNVRYLEELKEVKRFKLQPADQFSPIANMKFGTPNCIVSLEPKRFFYNGPLISKTSEKEIKDKNLTERDPMELLELIQKLISIK